MQKYSYKWFCYHIVNNPLSLWLFSNRKLYLIEMTEEARQKPKSKLPFRVNSWDDLEKFEATESWHNRQKFLDAAKGRLADGACCITLVQDDHLAFIDWVKPDVEKSTFGYIQQTVIFPPRTATQYSGYVHPAYRKRGIYSEGMRHVAEFVFSKTDTVRQLAAVEGSNRVARDIQAKLGARLICLLETRCVLGYKSTSAHMLVPHYRLHRDSSDPFVWHLKVVEKS